MYFIVRDDDPSGWTNVGDLIKKYEFLFSCGVRVSVGVIPYSIKSINAGNPSKFHQKDHSFKALGENQELVDYLKSCQKENKIEIMLHGFNHTYYLSVPERIKPRATKLNIEKYKQKYSAQPNFFAEYAVLPYDDLYEKTSIGKQYLEDIFNTKISVFVPPSNQINNAGLRAIVNNNLNLSGLIGYRYDRPLSVVGCCSYLKRWAHRFRNTGVAFPYAADYRTHLELASNGLGPSTNRVLLEYGLEWIKNKQAPFCINTHYWELDKDLLNYIEKLSKHCDSIGFKSATVSEVLNK